MSTNTEDVWFVGKNGMWLGASYDSKAEAIAAAPAALSLTPGEGYHVGLLDEEATARRYPWHLVDEAEENWPIPPIFKEASAHSYRKNIKSKIKLTSGKQGSNSRKCA